MQPTQKQLYLVLLALLVLRVVTGLHFYMEGVTKIKDGDFTCAPFLQQARGPFAEHFHGLLDDHDGRLRLCLSESDHEIRPGTVVIDTFPTFAIWENYIEQADQHFDFDADQRKLTRTILSESKKSLAEFFGVNEIEILRWYGSRSRLDGFARDGESRNEAVEQVASLNEQRDTISRDRRTLARPWLSSVESCWDELEARVNQIAAVKQGNEDFLTISRPFRQPGSPQSLIDDYLPWFDLFTGALLVLGLLTRVASLAGIGLLLGVVATQPFWVMGSQNTFSQWIEIASLLVLFATAAGRFGGLDYFLARRTPEDQVEE